MSEFAVYEVVGPRRYRGHATGTTFMARLDRNAERRAVARGDIRFLKIAVPVIEAGSYAFPRDWLPPPDLTSHQSDHQRRREAPLSLRKE